MTAATTSITAIQPAPAASEWKGRRFSWLAILPYLLITVGIGGLDVLTGYEMSEIALYPIPAIVAAWRLGYGASLACSIFAAAAWYVSKWITRPDDVSHLMIFWNAAQRLGLFLCVVFFVVQLRSMKIRQSRLLASDSLTGLQTRQVFMREASGALSAARQAGHSAALALIDVDSLCSINARLGQQRGDMVLLAVARAVWVGHRASDVIGRISGDDFAVLMIDVTPQQAAERVALIRKVLGESSAAGTDGVTVSSVLITASISPSGVEPLLQAAEEGIAQAPLTGPGSRLVRSI